MAIGIEYKNCHMFKFLVVLILSLSLSRVDCGDTPRFIPIAGGGEVRCPASGDLVMLSYQRNRARE